MDAFLDEPSREDRLLGKYAFATLVTYPWDWIGRNDAIALFSGQITETHPEFPLLTSRPAAFLPNGKKMHSYRYRIVKEQRQGKKHAGPVVRLAQR
jgi:hypothetical protein